jgi:hypothetical protein
VKFQRHHRFGAHLRSSSGSGGIVKICSTISSIAILLVLGSVPAVQATAQLPSIAAGETIVATFRAEGAQVYECKPDASNTSASQLQALTWQFREPIATLILDGKSVGRHFAGPNWDHIDGSGVRAKVSVSAPAATPGDIPNLQLEVVEHRGNGILTNVTAVRRINTKGGMLQGPCEIAGGYRSIPYSADYVFLRRSD